MLKLNPLELPAGEFSAQLPPRLGPGGPCYIRFKFKPGGGVNPEFTAGVERIRHAEKVARRVNGRITDDEAHVAAVEASARAMGRQWWAVLHDTCVIEWETNIQNGGKALETTRENFLALTEVQNVASIAQALVDLQAAIAQAGKDAAKIDEDSLKN